MKILAVDDDRVALKLLKMCLSSAGYEDLETALSASEAMEKIKKTKVQFDCILLDIEMPTTDGIKACADIRALDAYKHTPIIMITRRNDSPTIERAFAKGATDYIKKPYVFLEVTSRVKIAERLVQERQAAMDSYLALRMTSKTPKMITDHSNFQILGAEMLSNNVLENYLEQMTRVDGSQVSMITFKIADIDHIFSKLSADDFIVFLETVMSTFVEDTNCADMFLSQFGNGTFVCVANKVKFKAAEAIERDIVGLLRQNEIVRNRFSDVPIKLFSGEALTLRGACKPKFKRALKVCLARLASREAQFREHLALAS
jgi:CheY-like chemotaxis protein